VIWSRVRSTWGQFPAQVWLFFAGMIISRMGASMTWPFLVVYMVEQLELPLASVTSLVTINSATGLLAALVVGPIADRAGRKGVMVNSLLFTGLGFLGLIWARDYWHFALLMAVRGAFGPLYEVGSNAMLADLIPPGRRDEAYALLRLGSNLGIAVGPALGGIIASRSYATTFALAAAGMVIFGLLILLFARETLPQASPTKSRAREPLGGYLAVIRDTRFVLVTGAFTLVMVSTTILWLLQAVYAKQQYGVTESQYGFIPMTNALMVVLFQMGVTRRTRRYPALWMMALGALLYALGVGSVALGAGFWAFWASMVVLTVGELILMPTASTYIANLAPADMRGRYMGLYSLTWYLASAVGPVSGGVLSDTLGPRAMWYGGGMFGLASTLGFAVLAVRAGRRPGSELAVGAPGS